MDYQVTTPIVSDESVRSGHTGRSGPCPVMVLAVAVLHVAVISTFAMLVRPKHVPSPPVEMAVPVVFEQAPPPPADPKPRLLASSTLRVPIETVPTTLTLLPNLALRPVPRGVLRRPAATPRPLGAFAAAPVPPAGAPPTEAAPSDATQHSLAAWEARIRQAVQDAAIYPPSARLLRRDGRAQVQFSYDRGAVSLASVVQTSHFAALDTAALAAVTRAAMPDPPPGLGPQKRLLLVWVQFTLVSDE